MENKYFTPDITDIRVGEATPYEKSMQYLRKIAALCVQAGEQYGMPNR